MSTLALAIIIVVCLSIGAIIGLAVATIIQINKGEDDDASYIERQAALTKQQKAEPVPTGDERGLEHLGDEIHNASCIVIHLNEEIGEHLGRLASELWDWEKTHPPAAQQQEAHPDDIAVMNFAEAMKAKMAASREKGRTGWDDPVSCSGAYLAELLVSHVEKGDPVDIANFCMMIYQRGISGHEIRTAWSDAISQQQEAEPVGVVNISDCQSPSSLFDPETPLRMAVEETAPRSIQGLPRGTKLYLHPPITAAQTQVPDGYVLVPIRPLETVLRISDREHEAWDAVKAAMLYAAAKEEL